jgi:hypothetical protein
LTELARRATLEQEAKAAAFEFDAEMFAASLLTNQETIAYNDELTAQKLQEHENSMIGIRAASAQLQLSATSNLFSNLANLAMQGGKKGVKIAQTIAIAQGGIKAVSAGISAFEAGMGIGGPAAPLTAASYATASLAATAGMISNLKSGGKSQSKPSMSLPSASSAGGNGNNGSQQTGTTKRFDLTLVGSTFSAEQVRELMGQFSEQIGDGVEFNTN